MFDPAKASKAIREEFINYITTSYPIYDPMLNTSFKKQLSKVISKGPIIEINEIFETGKSLRELISEGILARNFSDIESMKSGLYPYTYKLPLDRPLYLHQEKAIRRAIEGKNLVVSTGTGSGKTESFLIPILNELMLEIDNGTLDHGVRAILIYPMNALANDQLMRIREILLHYPKITFGVYNGATEHNDKKATGLYEAMFENEVIPELRKPLVNEFLSREKLQETPPHILFTNYAMLEHMLLRPNDGKVFVNSKFKYVVLDEAHVYYGATGMETAMLIRRLKARIANKIAPQFILTSATLGSINANSGSNLTDIIKFAKNLTGEEFSAEGIITAEKKNYFKPESLTNYHNELFLQLNYKEESSISVLKSFGFEVQTNNELPTVFYKICNSAIIFHRIRQSLETPKSIQEVASELDISEELVISVLHVASRANMNNFSLINAKYHYFLRALEGLYLEMYPTFKISLVRQTNKFVNEDVIPVFEVATCNDCGKLAVIGTKDKQKREITRNVPHYSEDISYFYINEKNDENLFEDEDDEIYELNDFILCKKCGCYMELDEENNPPCNCIKTHGVRMTTSPNEKCPFCGVGNYNRFYLGSDAATAVIGLSLFDQLPEYLFKEPKKIFDEDNDNPFNLGVIDNLKEKEKIVKQYLVFSDSRQEAAYFSSYMTYSHKQFLRRRGLYYVLNSLDFTDSIQLSDIVSSLSALFSNPENVSFSESVNDKKSLSIVSKRQAWIAILDEIANHQRSTSLSSLGFVSFEYKGNDNIRILNSIAKKYNLECKTVKNLLNRLFMDFMRSGAIDTSQINELQEEDRELIFYYAKQKYLVKSKDNKDKYKLAYNVLPTRRENDKGFYKTNRMELIKRTLNVEDEEAATFLLNYWDSYLTNQASNEYKLITKDSIHYTIDPNSIAVVSNFNEKNLVYKCDKCGKITSINVLDCCSNIKCEGKLKRINVIEENKDNHYVKLYSRKSFSPFFIKEHTAQLSRRESLDYQKDFVQKNINALSCSTTFEMGVDVGSLETVFLRNMPPMPSNYAQRAGRAGRSSEASAFALTYAKLSSHDFNFYQNPLSMIKGKIMPPIFKTDNEKVIQRHINAIVLSYFFQIYPELYDGNKITEFIDNKGYTILEKLLKSQPLDLK